jgi:hypothetical protein
LAKAAGVSANTVKAARRGERLRRSTLQKLKHALRAAMATSQPANGKPGEPNRAASQSRINKR